MVVCSGAAAEPSAETPHVVDVHSTNPPGEASCKLSVSFASRVAALHRVPCAHRRRREDVPVRRGTGWAQNGGWGEGWRKGPLRWPQPSSRPLSYKALPRAHRQRSQHSWIAVFARCRSAAQRERSRDGSQATEQHHRDSRGQQLVTAPFPVPSFGCQGSCGAAHPISLAAPCSEGTKRTAECIDGDSHVPYQKTAASITKSPGSTLAPAPPHPPPRSWVRGLGHDVRT